MTKKTKNEPDDTPEGSHPDEDLVESSDDENKGTSEEDDALDESGEEEDSDDPDDEDDPGEEDEDDERSSDDDQGGRDRKPKPVEAAALTVFLLIGVAFGINGWVNVQAAEAVGQRCSVAEQQMGYLIEQSEQTPLLAPNWLQSFRRARRIYIREICDRTVDRLAWWRWNLLRPVEIRLSHQAEQDIERALVRAGSSCESEIVDNEQAFQRTSEREIIEPRVRTVILESFEWQHEACRELGDSVEGGYWPPLRALGPSDVPKTITEIMPESEIQPGERSVAEQ